MAESVAVKKMRAGLRQAAQEELVRELGVEQLKKLKANDHKGLWFKEQPNYLLSAAQNKLDLLKLVINSPNYDYHRALELAADISNLVGMAYQARLRKH